MQRFDHGSISGRVIVAPTVTVLEECEGAVLVTGSHGGVYPGALAARARVRAAVFHDAGVGLQRAGIAALDLLASLGISAAAVSHESSRIGDPEDMLKHGFISHANAPARRLGVVEGKSVALAIESLMFAPQSYASGYELPRQHRDILLPGAGGRPLVFVDSAAQVDPLADAGAVVITGSHGGLIAADPARALKAAAFGAAFNDAGGGGGTTRLGALEEQGVAAITVAADSARIGDAFSTFAGIVSAANHTALGTGAVVGAPASSILLEWSKVARRD
jgi:hypothetical protein